MAGGIGSVVRSMVAVVTLISLYNGLSLFGLGIGIQVLINGIVLAVIVFQEVYFLYHQNRVRGQRRDLIEEIMLGQKK
jgi:ABC-type xylose transport system permease subunit